MQVKHLLKMIGTFPMCMQPQAVAETHMHLEILKRQGMLTKPKHAVRALYYMLMSLHVMEVECPLGK